MHGKTADESPANTRFCARQEGDHDQSRCDLAVPRRQGQPGLRGEDAEPALGLGLHLCFKRAWDGLRCFRDPRLRPKIRRLARLDSGYDKFCSRYPEPGDLPAAPSEAGRLILHIDQGRHRHFGRQRPGFL